MKLIKTLGGGASLLLLLLSQQAQAVPVTQMDWCKEYSKYAERVMEARQNGVAMSKLTDIIAKSELDDKPYYLAIIMAAYESRRWHTEDAQQREVTEHGNLIFGACISGELRPE